MSYTIVRCNQFPEAGSPGHIYLKKVEGTNLFDMAVCCDAGVMFYHAGYTGDPTRIGSTQGASRTLQLDLSANSFWQEGSLAYHDGYYYFGSSDGMVARTPSLETPTFEFYQMSITWQKVAVSDLASFASKIVAAGSYGKLATANL